MAFILFGRQIFVVSVAFCLTKIPEIMFLLHPVTIFSNVTAFIFRGTFRGGGGGCVCVCVCVNIKSFRDLV